MTADLERLPSVPRRLAIWIALSVLAALVTYTAFRGYLTPEFLLNFANAFYC